MKALTLWQPWASLIALGAKTIETRSWPAPPDLIGQTIAIHAATRRPWKSRDDSGQRAAAMTKVIGHDFAAAMRTAGIEFPLLWSSCSPLGAVVATARVVECLPMVGAGEVINRPRRAGSFVVDTANLGGELTLVSPENWPGGESIEAQRPFGDFAPGRWVWMLADVEALSEPIPARGGQRIWNWDGNA